VPPRQKDADKLIDREPDKGPPRLVDPRALPADR